MDGQDLDPMTEMTVELRYLRKDFAEMKQDIKDLASKPCPSAACIQCQTDIAALKTTNENRKDSGNDIVAWSAVIVAIVAVIITVIA